MSDIPEFFERGKDDTDRGPELYPFLYDASVQQFAIAGVRVALEDFDPYTFIPHRLPGLAEAGIKFDDMPEHALLLPDHGAVIAGPKLHEWAINHAAELSIEARKTMVDAYRVFMDDDDLDLLEEDITGGAVGHIGFAAGLGRHEEVHLQVFGDCACMFADSSGWQIQGQFEAGFAEYALHNADTQAQRASLYAGIGHLARLASGVPAAQGSLF